MLKAVFKKKSFLYIVFLFFVIYLICLFVLAYYKNSEEYLTEIIDFSELIDITEYF